MKKSKAGRLSNNDRMLISDVDNTLIGDAEALDALLLRLCKYNGKAGLGIATGRSLPSALKALNDWGVPLPDLLITSVGSEIHYGPEIIEDRGWTSYIDYLWEPSAIREALHGMKDLVFQPAEAQRRYKVSYYTGQDNGPDEIRRRLKECGIAATVIHSHVTFIDILPIRASKGAAVRYFSENCPMPFEKMLLAGDSANDMEMLRQQAPAVVVGNYQPELERLRGEPSIYFAKGLYAWGILEAMDHYNFGNELGTFNSCS